MLSKIKVDIWEVNYKDNLSNGHLVLEKSVLGLVEIKTSSAGSATLGNTS